MKFLISTSYRTTGKSVIWKIDTNSLKLELFREDHYYQSNQLAEHNDLHTSKVTLNSRVMAKDYIYFGMGIYAEKVYCAGGDTLSILDLKGDLLKRKKIDLLKDVHDLRIIDEQIYCTNTGHDTVEIFSTDLEHKKTVYLKKLPCFSNKKLLPQKDKYDTDSFHANFLSSRNGEVFITHFFTCERNRIRAMILTFRYLVGIVGWQPFRHKGFVLNPFSGKILNTGGVITTNGEQIISPLYGPHDGMFYKNEFYIHSTHNIETHIYDENFKLAQRIQYNVGGFLRGLHPIDQETFLVGASRIDPKRTAAFMYKLVLRGRKHVQFDEASSIKMVDRKTQTILKSIYFDTFQGIHPEIYKIIPFSG